MGNTNRRPRADRDRNGCLSIADGQNVYVREADVPNLEFDSASPDLSAVEFQDSLIDRLELDRDASQERLPRFNGCVIGTVEGRVGPTDMPSQNFVNYEFGEFAQTTATTAG